MGGGRWDVSTYSSSVATKRATGTPTFAYSSAVSSGAAPAVANDLLDPKAVAGPDSPFAGKVMREVTISDEHPNPTPIAVVLDVTGSNYAAAQVVHSKLPTLLGVLQRKGYVEDPQINVCAIGDANSDRVPLQVGQFESDNRIDEQIEAIFLEGSGGGGNHETYELGAYFLARHTHSEPFEKEGRKGYAIFIGDERPYKAVLKGQVRDLIGDNIQADIPTQEIFDELQEKYEVFFLWQEQGSYSEGDVLPEWREILGERALVLEDPAAVTEFIAGLLGMLEGGLDLDEAEADLLALGADPKAVGAASKALATVTGGGGSVTTTGELPEGESDSGTTRL